jgi:hypothetical protein
VPGRNLALEQGEVALPSPDSGLGLECLGAEQSQDNKKSVHEGRFMVVNPVDVLHGLPVSASSH